MTEGGKIKRKGKGNEVKRGERILREHTQRNKKRTKEKEFKIFRKIFF